MIEKKERFLNALRLIDEANSKDPNQERWKEKTYPKEVLYSLRMTEKLYAFYPGASEALQIAARCQHICRWEIPRSNYPMDRKGYLQWRTQLKNFHAQKAADILLSLNYNEALIERVKFLLLKKKLKLDTETQILEDVICLVFLEYYYDAFSAKYPEEKLIDILQKTWRKMSERGKQAALKLPLSANALNLIAKVI